ncbi:hypothetical protein [Pseudomonas sp. Pc102]|uniref:hypothetical protein n=1 Tax=Pseudomonas sp. Pc102 TaxID=2678261 RepID=UPI001BCF5AD7|nr:hypothetical protein [Pseudomonas sp. Pc102]
MPVPIYDQLMKPILRYLAATPEVATARDAHEAAAEALSLSKVQCEDGDQRMYKKCAGRIRDNTNELPRPAAQSGSRKRSVPASTIQLRPQMQVEENRLINAISRNRCALRLVKFSKLAKGYFDKNVK